MNTATFATFLALSGLFGGLIGALLVRRRLAAEREMARSLATLLYQRELQGKEPEESRATIERFEADAGSMAGLLEEAAKRLAESDRVMILRALRQSSEQGRKAYVRKLIREAQVANAGCATARG
jgi:hypothetical protein